MHSLFFCYPPPLISFFFFFFNDTATTEIYTLSLHDALPILRERPRSNKAKARLRRSSNRSALPLGLGTGDRKSTRLNSSHGYISYAVFCLKKKKKVTYRTSNRHIVSRNQSTRYTSRPAVV